MDIVLDDWQKEIMNTEGNIALRSGRQVGKSTVISILAGDYAVKNPNKVIMVIASVERQAYLLFEKILIYLEGKYRDKINSRKKPTKSRVSLKNGSIIYCLPTGLAGYGIRGYTIDLLIADEAAFIPDNVFSAVTPAIATRIDRGAKIVLLSTPHGKKGYFARAFNDDSFKTFHISSEECPRINKEFLEQEKRRMSKREYAQEYLGEFVDELMQFFPDKLIRNCMNRKRPNGIERGRRFYLGVDLARMGDDESTFEIFELGEDKKLFQVENQVTKRTLLSQSTSHILNLDKLYNFEKIFIDDEGIGVGVFDFLLEHEQTKRKVIPINNSKRILDKDETQKTKLLKEDLYNNLLRLMETGQIYLLDDDEIFMSLKSVQYEYTSDSKGKPNLRIFGNYTHIAEGIIRAAWCVKYKTLNIWIKSLRV
jgi:hypothetical protein